MTWMGFNSMGVDMRAQSDTVKAAGAVTTAPTQLRGIEMDRQGPVVETIAASYAFAARAFMPSLPSLPYLLAFAVAVAILASEIAAPLPPMLWLIGFLLAAGIAFAAGCIYSAKLYGLALRTGPSFPARDDVINLGFANAAVYLLFGLLSFFVGFFLLMLPGVLMAQSGLLNTEQAQSDPEAVQAALGELMRGPGGVIVALVALAGFIFLAYVALRLVMFGIATFARGEIRVLSTWGWTKGNLAKIAQIAVFTHGLPFLVVFAALWLLRPIGGDTILGAGARAFVNVLLSALVILPGHGMATKVYLMLAPNLVEPQKAAA